MDAFLSCFACGQKSSSVIVPEKKPEEIDNGADSKIQTQRKLSKQIDDDKSRISMTTVTFITSETAPSKNGDDDSDIHKRIQTLLKKDLPERKAMEAEFVKQNLTKSKVIFLVEKKWSEEYTKFLKDHKVQSMRSIDNDILLDKKGGLKSNAKEKEDYFIITQRVWKFVQALYGGGPAIPKDCNFPVLNFINKRVEIPPNGMKNPLNLCFMISGLQMLFSIEQINYHFAKKLYLQTNETRKKPFSNLMHKFVKIAMDSTDTLEINDFAGCFQSHFNPYKQHDAQQFLLYLMDQIQEENKTEFSAKVLKTEFKDPQSAYSAYFSCHKSIIDRAFAGQYETSVKCAQCDFVSLTYSPFLEISLPIRADSLQQCLKQYFSSEKLHDLYSCERCKFKTKAAKQSLISKAPNFLFIALKKFTSTGKKIQDRITYPYHIDLKKFTRGHCGETTYSLSSLIIHKGSRITKGHYYCLTRRKRNKWFYFNDESVKELDHKDVLGRDPYILVYERDK